MAEDTKAADKQRRLAEALRANLKRRKAATRDAEARRTARSMGGSAERSPEHIARDGGSED